MRAMVSAAAMLGTSKCECPYAIAKPSAGSHAGVAIHPPGSGRVVTPYFSLRTPLKGLASALTSMNLPLLSSRLVQVPVIGFLICERVLTAPLRWLSPTVLFFAMTCLLGPLTDTCLA